MTPLLLALASQRHPALTPIDVRSPLFEAPRSAESLDIVSEDGAALIAGWSRVDLRTGKTADGEALKVALRQPPHVYARSMSQGFGPTISPPGPLVFAPHFPTLYAAALDFDHVLVATEPPGGATVGDHRYIPLTEFDLRQRGSNPNRSWTVRAPAGSQLLSLRYLGSRAIEAWVGEPRGKGWSLARYVGDRRPGGGDAFARLTSRVPVRWPLSEPKVYRTPDSREPKIYYPPSNPRFYYTPNSFDPEGRTLALGSPSGGDGRLRLVDAAGRVVKVSIPTQQSVEWVLRVRDAEVPGGKAAWEPLACSGSRKLWLLRRKADAKVFLLRR